MENNDKRSENGSKAPKKSFNFYWIYGIIILVILSINLFQYGGGMAKIDPTEYQKMLDAGARFAGKTQTEELAFSMLGQILYFHLAGPVVRRRMEWIVVTPPEAEAIAATIDRNLQARLDADAEPVA